MALAITYYFNNETNTTVAILHRCSCIVELSPSPFRQIEKHFFFGLVSDRNTFYFDLVSHKS
jgi:hypothetical protein